METLQTGTIIKTVGLKGELKLKSTTFFAEDRYQKNNVVYLCKDGKNFKKCKVVSYRFYQGFDFVILKEINSIEIAEKYIGYNVFIDKNDAKLDKDMYFFCDLEKCKVIDFETKEVLGVVEIVEEFPAQITLAVKSNKTEKIFYVPFVNAFVKSVDIKRKEIEIKVIEGLLN